MPVELQERKDGKVLVVRLTGKLHKEDYAHFTPETERLIGKHGKIRVLMEMHDFHGWDLGAMWEDLKFDFHHFKDIERIAMIGESKWEKGMSLFCKPFTTAKVKFFEPENKDEALAWIEEGL